MEHAAHVTHPCSFRKRIVSHAPLPSFAVAQAPAFNSNPIVEMGDLTAKAAISRAGTLVARIGPAPKQVQFQLVRSAVAKLANGVEQQFRFTARMADGSYYNNRNDAYVSPGARGMSDKAVFPTYIHLMLSYKSAQGVQKNATRLGRGRWRGSVKYW